MLLTNRACGGGSLDEMRTVRRAFHDALGDALNLVIWSSGYLVID